MDSAFHTHDELNEYRKVYKNIVEEIKLNTKRIPSLNNAERSWQDTTLNVLTDASLNSNQFKYMYTNASNRIYFSDIFGSEFSWINDSVINIKNISLKASEVTVETLGGDDGKQRISNVLEFDPEHVNMDYLIPGKEKATPRKLKEEKSKSTEKDKTVSAYSSSYILDYEKTEITAELGAGTKVKVKNSVFSHDACWNECWDQLTDEYYGWILQYDLTY